MKAKLSHTIKKYLESKSIIVDSLIDAEIIIDQFKASLFKNQTKEKIIEFNLKQYPWHIFTYELVNCKEGIEAISAYENRQIKSYYTIITEEGYVFNCKDEKCITYSELIELKLTINRNFDIYVTHYNFKWVFALTHEEDCGPYFYMP